MRRRRDQPDAEFRFLRMRGCSARTVRRGSDEGGEGREKAFVSRITDIRAPVATGNRPIQPEVARKTSCTHQGGLSTQRINMTTGADAIPLKAIRHPHKTKTDPGLQN